MPLLSRINCYPFKSLDGQAVASVRVLESGALQYDRRFAVFDADGKVINGKRTPAVHRLQCEFDAPRRFVVLRLRAQGQAVGFHVDGQRTELENWLGEYFGLGGPAIVKEDAVGGFPDDLEAPGPTVISEATLAAVAGWFDGMTVDEARARFRPNLEISGVPAFWEDRLYASADEVVEFAVGETKLAGTNPCRRCVVPSRWSLTGEVGPAEAFAKTFSLKRRENLPPWANVSRFDHYYRLAVNTRPAQTGESIVRVGDEVRILGARPR
ncbi:MAG TPA: MOSC N-terminal beta barrel domain-containing protein [Pirellulales bacterium]|nr:MOSC N-terminal beta barrel domain-containing protein [Pirellulales bacterium]